MRARKLSTLVDEFVDNISPCGRILSLSIPERTYLYADGPVIAFARLGKDEAVVTVVSSSKNEERVTLPLDLIGAEYVPGTKSMQCPFCGRTSTEEEMTQGYASDTAPEQAGLREYHCQNCGAQIITASCIIQTDR